MDLIKTLFSTKGRIGRRELFGNLILIFIIITPVMFMGSLYLLNFIFCRNTLGICYGHGGGIMVLYYSFLFTFPLIVILTLIQIIKRLHDININGFFSLIFIIPIFWPYLLFAKGTHD